MKIAKTRRTEREAFLLKPLVCLILLGLTMAGFAPNRAYATTGSDLVRVAESQLGNGPYTYRKHFGAENTTNAWCHYFVSWCAAQVGIEGSYVPHKGRCADGVSWYMEHPTCLWHAVGTGYTPKAGDIVYFHNNSGSNTAAVSNHVGIVTGCSNGKVYTIEGNTHGKVERNGGGSGYPADGSAIWSNQTRIVGYGSWESGSVPPTPEVDHNPVLTVDSVVGGTQCVTVGGWAYDPDDTNASLGIHVYVGGAAGDPNAWGNPNTVADNESPDVERVMGVGGRHRFNATIPVPTKSGNQPVYVYAMNIGAGSNAKSGPHQVSIRPEGEAPVISDVKVVNITPNGYRVSCKVTDNVGVTDVKFPTWTSYNGQDDLGVWRSYGSKVGDVYTFDVNISDHNNEHGVYHTHIYAYDAAGNSSCAGYSSNVMVPNKMVNEGGSTYYLFEDSLSWEDARNRCANAFGGGHLVTIDSASENETVANLAKQGGKNAYWIGANDVDEEGSWKWVTGENLGYTAWADTEPNGGTAENAAAINSKDSAAGKWCDYSNGVHGDFGFIMEVDGGAFEQQGDVVTDLEDGIYSINMFANGDYAVDVSDGATGPGCNVQLWSANGSDYQRWKFTKNDDDTYRIVNVKSGCSLDVYGANQGNNGNVQVWENNDTAAQRWYVERDSTGSYFLRAKCSNCYLDVAGYSFANGCNMITWYANGNNQQRFSLVRAERIEVAAKRIYDVTPDGYKVEVELELPKGSSKFSTIDHVEFPTWTSGKSSYKDDERWANGTVVGNVATFEVKTSNHGNRHGLYWTHAYVVDGFGSRYWLNAEMNEVLVPERITSIGGKTYYLVPAGLSWEDAKKSSESFGNNMSLDAHLATMHSPEEKEAVISLVSHGSKSMYWIGATDADSEGMWSWVTGEAVGDEANWATGEPGGGTSENYAGMDADTGLWRDHSGNKNDTYGLVLEVEGDDRCAPIITDAHITDLDESGYTVVCAVEDPAGIEKVEFPTWVPEKGETGDNALWKAGELYMDSETGKTVAEFRVSTEDHNGATGEYATHIYATDTLGNKTKIHFETKVENVLVPNAIYGAPTGIYYRFDCAGKWTDAKAYVDAMPIEGMQLATVANEADDDAIASLLAGADKSAYWLGLSDAEGSGDFAWVDDSNLGYNHWASGQPGTYTGARYGAVLVSNSKWYGYTNSGVNAKPANMGFIAMVGYSQESLCAEGHTWSEWETIAEASCTEAGIRARWCEVCGEAEREELPKLGHDEGEPVEEERHEPTCTKAGSVELVTYCKVCGEELNRESQELPKLDHTPRVEVRENEHAATCSAEGHYDSVRYCEVCGEEVSREGVTIPTIDHTWNAGEITVEPTCTEAGERTFTCSVCGAKKTEEVEAAGHIPGLPVSENESAGNTCVEGGTFDEVVYCEVCHEELSRTIRTQPAGEHMPVTDPAVPATCTQEGLTEGSHCQVCGTVLVEQQKVPALGHTEETVEAVAPTCTEPGSTEGKRCKVCGEVLSGCEPIAALGHNYTEEVIKPTCASYGYTEHRCSRCDDVYITDRIAPLAHKAGDPEVESEEAATCTSQGKRTLVTKCTECGKVLYRTSETTPMTEHVGGAPEVVDESVATCERAGFKTTVVACKACGKEMSRSTEIVPAAGHTWDKGEVTKQATCSEPGTKTYTCATCGATRVEQIPAGNHIPGKETHENEASPTCTANGSYESVVHCERCGIELSRQIVAIPALGHDWSQWEVAREATVLREGLKIRTCKRCNMSETASIPKLVMTNISSAAIGQISAQTYTGKALKPGIAVTLGGKTLVEGTDYTVAYKDNTNAGTATVTVTGKGNYAGSKSATFRISPAGITSVTVSPASYTYDGKAKTPAVTVKAGLLTVPSSGYAVSYKDNTNAGTATVTVTGGGNYTGSKSATFSIAKAATHVAYRTHVQSFGWQGFVRDGAMSGTSGQSKRLEGIEIKLEGAPATGSVEYRTHVQSYGWQAYKRDGAMSGTSGEAKRLEAIQIRLTGKMAEGYDVWYRVHAQRLGWMGWAKDDAPAGTAGYAYRLEGIEIRVLPKGSAAPGSQVGAFESKTGSVPASSASGHAVSYRTHVQSIGWQAAVADGTASGTFGMAKRLEGIEVSLPDRPASGGVEYRTHVQSYGWQAYRRDGAMSGTSGESKRLEAIQVRLYGEMAQRYDVWYRVHAQTFGWMGWAKNDQQAGTAGYAKRLEAIQILVLPKGSAAPGATANAFRKR